MGTAYLFLLSALNIGADGLQVRRPQLMGLDGMSLNAHGTDGESKEVQLFKKDILASKSFHLVQKTNFNIHNETELKEAAAKDSTVNPMYNNQRMWASSVGNWTPHCRYEPAWCVLHNRIVDEAKAWTPSPPGQHKLVLFGDSLMEQWRGTELGLKAGHDVSALMKVVDNTIKKNYPEPHISAVWADTYQQLYWRLQHGALSPAMAADENVMFSVLIGQKSTPGMPEQLDTTVQGILNTTRFLLEKTKGKLLLNGLLPAGMRFYNEEWTGKINKELQKAVPKLKKEFPGRVEYAACDKPFNNALNKMQPVPSLGAWSTTPLMEGYVPGGWPGTHPNDKGTAVWAKCMLAGLKKLESQF